MSDSTTTHDLDDDQDGPQQPTVTLDDPDEFHRAQRLREIHQARRRVHEVIRKDAETVKQGTNRRGRYELGQAVAMYISELEAILESADTDLSLPEHYPWDTLHGYADILGGIPEDFEGTDCDLAPRPTSITVFRHCNRLLAEIKPIIDDSGPNEWDV